MPEKVKEREYYQRGIERLHTAFLQQHSVALMCSEGKPEECHRCKLIGATLTTQNILVIHIDENDEQVTQEKVIERLTGGRRCSDKGCFTLVRRVWTKFGWLLPRVDSLLPEELPSDCKLSFREV